MHPATMLTAFVTVFVLELPDKTMLATIVLSARYRRPLAVWAGAASALTLQMVLASAAGGLLNLLPTAPVRLGVAVLFGIGAVVLWRSSAAADEEADDAEAAAATEQARAAAGVRPWYRISPVVFAVVFAAEWGDLTQLATASLASEGRPVSVFAGAALAMLTVAGIGVLAGRALLRVMPEHLLRKVAAGIFATLASVALWSAVSSWRDGDDDAGATPPSSPMWLTVQPER